MYGRNMVKESNFKTFAHLFCLRVCVCVCVPKTQMFRHWKCVQKLTENPIEKLSVFHFCTMAFCRFLPLCTYIPTSVCQCQWIPYTRVPVLSMDRTTFLHKIFGEIVKKATHRRATFYSNFMRDVNGVFWFLGGFLRIHGYVVLALPLTFWIIIIQSKWLFRANFAILVTLPLTF